MFRLLLALTLMVCTTANAMISADGEIRDFTLSTCLPEKAACVLASSPLASGSFIGPVYSFDTLDLTVKTKTKEWKWKSARGWFNLQTNQIVVIDKNKKETLINIDSIEVVPPEKI